MRIALMTEAYYPYINGVITHVETLKKGLEARGHQVLIVTLNPQYKHHTVKDGILYCPAKPILSDYGYGVANPWSHTRMEILRDFHPDLIHMHTEGTLGIFAMRASKKLGVPLVYTLHTLYDEYFFYVCKNKLGQKAIARVSRVYFRNLCKKTAQIIGPSQKTASYIGALGVTKEVNVVPNTVDLSDFGKESAPAEAVAALREKLGIREGDVAVCFVGRLGQEKSIDTLIHHFSAHFRDSAGYKLFIIGDGPEKAPLEEMVRTLGMEKQIFLLGKIEHSELPAYYQAFDLFATASTTEMHSISMLEAMASGLYSVIAYDPKNEQQICPGISGEMFEDGEKFRALLEKEMSMSEEDRVARREKLEDYMKQYGSGEFIDSILSVYDKALTSRKAKVSRSVSQ